MGTLPKNLASCRPVSRQQEGQYPGLIVWGLGGREVGPNQGVQTHMLVISVQLGLGRPGELEAFLGLLT